MIKTFTHEKLIRYAYNELPAKEHDEIERALRHDPDLAARCADILLAFTQLACALICHRQLHRSTR